MAENEEDYLDGLLKSLSEDENAQSENKDEEEEQIKEQVREAFEKSNEKSTKFENIYDDEDGNLNEEAKSVIEILEQYEKTFQERNPNLFVSVQLCHTPG